MSLRSPEMKLSHKMTATAALAVGALALPACLEASPPLQGDPNAMTSGVVGDSLIYGAEHGSGLDSEDSNQLLTDELIGRGYQANVAATIGATTKSLDYVGAPKRTHWRGFSVPLLDAAVVALGSNDLHIDTSTGQAPITVDDAIENVADMIDGEAPKCAVLIGIYESDTPKWRLDIHGPEYNQKLENLAIQVDGIFVDWNEEVVSETMIGPDGIHHTAVGSEAYRQSIADGVDDCMDKILAEN